MGTLTHTMLLPLHPLLPHMSELTHTPLSLPELTLMEPSPHLLSHMPELTLMEPSPHLLSHMPDGLPLLLLPPHKLNNFVQYFLYTKQKRPKFFTAIMS